MSQEEAKLDMPVAVEAKGRENQVEKAGQSGDGFLESRSAYDRSITRKLDRHIIPWLFGLWLLAFIDRSNIGNARIDGLATDLKLVGNKFNIVCPLNQWKEKETSHCELGTHSVLHPLRIGGCPK